MTNRERKSSTVSSASVGRCAMSTISFLSGPTRYLTSPDWELVHQDAHARGDRLEPRGDDALAVGLASHDERGHLQRLLPHVDHVVGGDLEGRDVDLLAVHLEVTVHDELTSVATRAGEPGAVDHVVEAALEQLEQVVTGLAGAARGLDVVVVELTLED